MNFTKDELGRKLFELMRGDVRIWIEQEEIHMRVRDCRSGDPVELAPHQAREIAAALLEFAKLCD